MKKVSFLILVLLLSFLRCGYHLRGTGSFLPSHIKRVRIPMFINQTTRFELDLKLTRSIIDEFVNRGGVEIAKDEASADAVLIGEITSFNVYPIAFTGNSTADRYNITVVIKFTMRDVVKRKIIYSNFHYVYQEEYEVPVGTDFETVETEAVDRIAEKVAREVVITILEGF